MAPGERAAISGVRSALGSDYEARLRTEAGASCPAQHAQHSMPNTACPAPCSAATFLFLPSLFFLPACLLSCGRRVSPSWKGRRASELLPCAGPALLLQPRSSAASSRKLCRAAPPCRTPSPVMQLQHPSSPRPAERRPAARPAGQAQAPDWVAVRLCQGGWGPRASLAPQKDPTLAPCPLLGRPRVADCPRHAGRCGSMRGAGQPAARSGWAVRWVVLPKADRSWVRNHDSCVFRDSFRGSFRAPQAKELEDFERRAAGMKSKSETQSKYGW